MNYTDDHHDDMAEEFYDICKLCHDKPCVCPPRESKDDVIADLRQQVERLRAELAEAKKYGAPVADARRLPHAGKKTCEHNDYWTTAYGGCMACRAVTAEAELSRAREAMVNCLKEVVPLINYSIEAADFMTTGNMSHERAKIANMLRVALKHIAAAAVRVQQETMCSLCDHPMSEHGKHGCGVPMDSAWTASNTKPCGCRGVDNIV